MANEKVKEKADTFDKTNENFKKIFTDNGMNLDEFSQFILNAIELIPDEEKVTFAAWIVERIVIYSAVTTYESVGILESAKDTIFRWMKCPDLDVDNDIEDEE
jgi:hypothetical protein